MCKSRFSEEQITCSLDEVQGGPKVKALCRGHRISEGTYHRRKVTAVHSTTQQVSELS